METLRNKHLSLSFSGERTYFSYLSRQPFLDSYITECFCLLPLPRLEKIAHEFQNLLPFQQRAGQSCPLGHVQAWKAGYNCRVMQVKRPLFLPFFCLSFLRCSTDVLTWPSVLSPSTRSVQKSSTSPCHLWRQASALWSPGATGQCLHQPFSVGKTAPFVWVLIERGHNLLSAANVQKVSHSCLLSPHSARMAYLDKFCLRRRFRKLPIKLLSRR